MTHLTPGRLYMDMRALAASPRPLRYIGTETDHRGIVCHIFYDSTSGLEHWIHPEHVRLATEQEQEAQP